MVIIGATLCIASFAILFVEALLGLNYWDSFFVFMIIFSVYLAYLLSI